MKQSSNKPWTLLHPPVGSITPHFDEFAQHLSEQGFKSQSIIRQVRHAAKYSLWLNANSIGLQEVTDECAGRFIRSPEGKEASHGSVDAALRRLMALLRRSGTIPEQPCIANETPIQVVIKAYGQHLRQDQGLSHCTCVQYLPFVEQFLAERFNAGPVALPTLSAADVIGFVRRQTMRLSQARARVMTIALRSFLRYLRCRGEITLDLAAGVPAVPNWSMTGIPRAISPDHVRLVLSCCDRDTPVGCRDYAVLLLLARLGLRSGEIVALTLDRFDWDLGCIKINGKGGQTSQLPLPSEVGEAIAAYLQRGRPRCDCRRLFLCMDAPIRGLGSQTSIASIVFAAIARAGIETRHCGAHQFRHALACEMLRQGATMTEIGSVLRHRHLKTTGIYAKVDFAALRPLSLPWPGDE